MFKQLIHRKDTQRNKPQNMSNSTGRELNEATKSHCKETVSLHRRDEVQSKIKFLQVRDYIILTPYPVEPGHTLISIVRLNVNDWKPEMRSNAAFVAEGDNAGIVINKPGSIMDFNRNQAGQKERQQPPNAKMSFKVFLINSETSKLTLEHRTLRFWLDQEEFSNFSKQDNLEDHHHKDFKLTKALSNLKQESSQLAQAYFCQLIGSKADDFPKNYVAFLMKLMRLLKTSQFSRVVKMEVELRQLDHEDHTKPPSRACKCTQKTAFLLISHSNLDSSSYCYQNPLILFKSSGTLIISLSLSLTHTLPT